MHQASHIVAAASAEAHGSLGAIEHGSMEDVAAARTLFWQNVMRQILTSLSVQSMNRQAVLAAQAREGDNAVAQPSPAAPDGNAGEPNAAKGAEDNLFDGRLAILTHAGERIPIADVVPLFACGINETETSRALSTAVECTVFQIRTPAGEVFTLPLEEMRAFHALTPELMQELERRSRAGEEEGSDEASLQEPFGFAAFTSLAKPEEQKDAK